MMSDPIHTLRTDITGNEGGPNYVFRSQRHYKQVAQIVGRLCCRVGYFWPKVEDWNWETIFSDITVYLQPL